MKFEGGCHCGAVKFEVVAPRRPLIMYCKYVVFIFFVLSISMSDFLSFLPFFQLFNLLHETNSPLFGSESQFQVG